MSQPAAAQVSPTCVLCDTNLVENPSAETYSGTADYDPSLGPPYDDGTLPIPADWATQNGLRVVPYGQPDFPTSSQVYPAPGATDPPQGTIMFCGSLTFGGVPARAYQDIDLAACEAEIDDPEGLRYSFGAYLGGNPALPTVAAAYAIFYDSALPPALPSTTDPLPPSTGGDVVGTATLGPADSTALPAPGTTGLYRYDVGASAVVPAGTRWVRIALEVTTPSGVEPASGRTTGAIDMIDFSLC